MKNLNELDVKLTFDGQDAYDTKEFPYVLAVCTKDCGINVDEGICEGTSQVEFAGSLSNAFVLIPSIISSIIDASDMDKDEESVKKFLDMISNLTIDFVKQKNESAVMN